MSVFISQFFAELLVPFGEAPPPPPVVPQARTMRFDAGLGAEWWILPQLAGDNLRDQVVKSFIATGKMTVPQFSVYSKGPGKNINIADMEQGINSATGKRNLPSTTQVQRYARRQANVPGSMLWTVRLEGIWNGEGIRDRVDEIACEVAEQGIRR